MDSYRVSRALEELTRNVMVNYENIQKSESEIGRVATEELEKYGVDQMISESTMCLVNITKRDILRNMLKRLTD